MSLAQPLSTTTTHQDITRESCLNRVQDFAQRASSLPTVADLMRFLVTNSLNPLGVKSTATLLITNNRKFRIQGSFGLTESQCQSLEKISLDSTHAIALAAQTTRHAFIGHSDDMAQVFGSEQFYILIPITRNDEVYGLLALVLKEQIVLDDLERTFLTTVAHILTNTSLHYIERDSTATAVEDHNQKLHLVTTSDNTAAMGEPDYNDQLALTERQKIIARMISNGSTNKEIAREMTFSEATIRYETIKLYERLRVRNRSQAAARIRELKIL